MNQLFTPFKKLNQIINFLNKVKVKVMWLIIIGTVFVLGLGWSVGYNQSNKDQTQRQMEAESLQYASEVAPVPSASAPSLETIIKE